MDKTPIELKLNVIIEPKQTLFLSGLNFNISHGDWKYIMTCSETSIYMQFKKKIIREKVGLLFFFFIYSSKSLQVCPLLDHKIWGKCRWVRMNIKKFLVQSPSCLLYLFSFPSFPFLSFPFLFHFKISLKSAIFLFPFFLWFKIMLKNS